MSALFAKLTIEGLGTLWVAMVEKKLVRIGLNESKIHFMQALPEQVSWQEVSAEKLHSAKTQLENYLAGTKIPLPTLELKQGTQFQQKVWKAMHAIPFAETRSYAWIAQKIGQPKAFRAVANACGRNPLPIVIPCHRVIASDGNLGGFSSGIEWKKRLLKLEKK